MRLADTLHFARAAATGYPARTALSVLAMAIGVAAVGCSILSYNYLNVDMVEAAHGRQALGGRDGRGRRRSLGPAADAEQQGHQSLHVGGNPPEHEAVLYFTRMYSGPMDFTPGIFDLQSMSGSWNDFKCPEATQVSGLRMIDESIFFAAQCDSAFFRITESEPRK